MAGTVGVRRPRRVVPEMPGGELVLEPPPEPERPVPGGLAARLLPLVMIAGSLLFVVFGRGEASSWLFGGMFALSAVGMLVAGGGRGAGARTATMDEDRRDYLRYLDVLGHRAGEIAAAQRHALETVHPEPGAWPDVLAAGRLWERRPGDDDFGRLRAGRGTQRLATALTAPQTGPLETLEPLSALALRRFLRRHSTVDDLPVAVDVRAAATVWLEPDPADGPAEPVLDLARALVAQYVLWHGPDDARLAVVAPGPAAARWDWAKWLPHVGHPGSRDAVGPVRMITDDPDRVRRWWVDEPSSASRHLLVVLDGAADTPGAWAGLPGVTVLRLGPAGGRRPAASVLRLAAGAGTGGEATLRRGGPGGAPVGVPDAVTVAEALALARRLARYRPYGAVDAGPAAAPDSPPAGLPSLLGLGAVDPGSIAALRRRRGPAERLRVPLGTDPAGLPVLLDIKESAHGGAGPHGLCIGATGSGKSELLRSAVLGLVATHAADELNLVLVDFKGGATFLGLAGLPHVSAVITNLAEELTLVDRMADALAGEITRRQELLRAAGNLASAAEYDAARQAGTVTEPLPSLLVVVDEFSELLAQRPEMIDLMVTVGRLGRSLGIHLLLASQRLEEGRLRGLESHLSYRIALRTFSAAESRAVLGVPDAHLLPPTPGAAYLSAGTDELVRFRAAYVSGPEETRREGRRRIGASREALPFRAGPVTATAAPGPGSSAGSGTRSSRPSAPWAVPPPRAGVRRPGRGGASRPGAPPPGGPTPGGPTPGSPTPGSPTPGGPALGSPALDSPATGAPAAGLLTTGSPAAGSLTSGSRTPSAGEPAPVTVLDRVVDAVSGPGPRAHRVWLPPLTEPPPLSVVLGRPVERPGRGLQAPGPAGRLAAPIGLIDRPYLQRRDALVVDLSGAAGHLAVVGGPRSGKSTALRTLVVALALTHTPAELGVHVLDLGGGALAPLAGLPHVGTVADRRRADLVRRVVAEAVATVEHRERLFAAHGISSVDDFRARRGNGELAGEPCTDLLLVVDGHAALRSGFEELDEKLTVLASRGLAYGVHLAMSAGRWAEFRPVLKDQLGSRLELRLGDPSDSEVDRRRAAAVPSRPGHGLAPDGEAAVLAAPSWESGADPAPDIAASWAGPAMPGVRLLPERIAVEELAPGPGRGPALGVDEDRLATVELDPDEPHLLCFADSGGGKTNLLRLLARGIAARWTPEQARIVVVDHRRTLLGEIPAPHLLAHPSTAQATADACAQIAGSLGRRLPGPDVTREQLRERSWWSGPDVWLLVDDYDLVVPGAGSSGGHPLLPLVEYLPQARDVGLHVVVARRSGGAARALFDPVLGNVRELGAPGLVGPGSPDEGALLEKVKPVPAPPGRMVLVDRRSGARRMQLAWADPG
ncbi:type VII secretion protein EccCa [Pseudonocardia parietis]|uniref:S-DNA-T family DNA segregation ATPase FtsK/SpoIIIE n=1 Tax=Pseudonocardia parietis TaxID=570936 RepID=A0ABS4VPG8_9PSEU|nr:type VII secretion protein EccCa [Pseudonocardia parietis]MBP2365826.1 S-DNA-T family DNA segregation ATPase FtsK/SpoIIIE [Pseudonocardia parietis]